MSEDGDRIHITRLEVRNFKKIRAGVWELKPGLNRLTSKGKNKQGKTSVLHAIRTLFEGAGAVPPEPINKEADPDDESLVRAWLNNGWSIRRKFTEKGTYLYVENPEGMKGNQGTINPWLGNGHFNPLGFFRMSSEEQARALLSLSSVEDLETQLENLRMREKDIYEQRTPYISEQRRLRGVPKPEHPKPEPVSVKEEMQQLGKLQAQQREWQDKARKKLLLKNRHEEIEEEQGRIRERIAQLQEDLKGMEKDKAEVEAAIDKIQEELAEQPDVEGQIEEVQARIEQAEEVQELREPWNEYERAQEQLETVEAKVKELTEAIEGTREKRHELIAQADFPVDGLSFSEEGDVLLNDLPLEQASGRERIELGVTAALAHNPRLRTVLVDEGNDLDLEGMEQLYQLAEEHELQLVVARLGLEGAGELEVVDGWEPSTKEELEAEEEEEGDDDE